VSPDNRPRTAPFSEDHNWPRHKPVFTLLAFLFALLSGLGVFTYQFKTAWTPLEQYYLPDYFRTAHAGSPSNRFLRPPSPHKVLVISYPGMTRMALDSEVVPFPPEPGARRGLVNFTLSQAARQGSARRLEWQTLRLDNRWLHAWLEHWIYADRSLWQLCRDAAYSALLALTLALPLAIRKDIAEGRKRRLGRALKGANLITRTQFHRRTRHYDGVGWLTKNPPTLWEWLFLKRDERQKVRIASANEWEHFLIVGDTGTGKSSLVRQLLIQIRERGETAIVYDPAREYLTQFFDPGGEDVILNPLDARMPYWTPADEICHHTEAEAIAKSLFPERDRENRFFVESPRKIFAHLLKYYPSPKDLCDWIARPDPEIDRRVAGTPLEAIIAKNAPQQRSGVLAVLERVSSAFSLLPARRNSKWSATSWGERRTGWVFVTTTPQTREILRPLISLWLDFLLLRLTAQTEPDLKSVWVILDELASLETLPTLPFALSESRKSNTRMVLGLQGRSQIEVRYGREAEAMLSQPRTKIFLRTSEPRAAEWISKSIGEVEIEHLREGRNVGDLGFRRSRNATVDRRIEAAILASEISNLENLEGYFQTPGYTLKLSFPYFGVKRRQPPLLRTEVPAPLVLTAPEAAITEPDENAQEEAPAQAQLKWPSSETTEDGENEPVIN
jgi:hypothetical protein